MLLTARDRKAVHAVYKYRYLTCEHIRALAYRGVDLRHVNRRLRGMWAHHVFDRFFFRVIADGTVESIRGQKTPLYTLAKVGAQVIWDDHDSLDWTAIPKTPKENRVGYARLRHNLVATDALVAMEVAGAATGCDVTTETESMLWRRSESFRRRRGYLISDGSFTVALPDGQRLSFHLEVVRADAKGGNATLLRKMQRYAELNRKGFFREAYGQDRVRAVLVATTTEARAENFRRLAADLSTGRSLFWFTSYEKQKSAGPPETHFKPETILDHPWTDVDGNTQTIRGALALTPMNPNSP